MNNSFASFAFWDFVSTTLRYFVLAVVPFFLLNKVGYFNKYKIESIYKTIPWTELKNSILSFITFCFVDFFTLVVLVKWQVSKLYFDPKLSQIGYEIFIFFLLLFFQDLSFYLIHRLLHFKPLFRTIHYVHHKSKNPTALASYSFHPIEAASMSLFFIIMSLFIPINMVTAGVFFFFSHAYNAYGHSSYNFKMKQGSFADRWILHSERHHSHHRDIHYNFGLYTTFWDRLFKTMSKK